MIPFYVALQGSNDVREVDTKLVYRDGASKTGVGGSAYACSLRTAPMHTTDHPGGFGFLGDVVQYVDQISGAILTITPVMDNLEIGTQEIAETLLTGDEAAVEFPFYAGGRQFQLDISFSGFTYEAELGKAEIWLIPRRAHK